MLEKVYKDVDELYYDLKEPMEVDFNNIEFIKAIFRV